MHFTWISWSGKYKRKAQSYWVPISIRLLQLNFFEIESSNNFIPTMVGIKKVTNDNKWNIINTLLSLQQYV